VNAYVLADARAIIDPGPAGAAALGALNAGLADAGLALSDIRAVLCTHAHAAHAGLAEAVREASGATVFAHPDAAALLTDPASERYVDFVRRAARAGAVPELVVEAALELIETPPPLDVVVPVADGQRLALGDRSWQVIATPGHAAGHVGYLDERSGEFVGGDVLARVQDTALPLEPRARSDVVRVDDLVGSWRRLARLPVQTVWPAHGPPIRAPRVLVARRLAAMRQRLQAARAAVPAEGATLWEVVMTSEEQPMAPDRLLNAVGSAAACLEWLVSRGVLKREDAAGHARFVPAIRKADARG
jgi:glyoxylase-like metal-dependent hydrolase (beta-lactamase superfamily II)